MRLHTELARPELYAALTRCKDAGLVAWHVFISRDDEYPVTKHSHSYEVELHSAHGAVTISDRIAFINEVLARDLFAEAEHLSGAITHRNNSAQLTAGIEA